MRAGPLRGARPPAWPSGRPAASLAVRPPGGPANPYDPPKGASASAGAPFSFAAVRASAARVAPAAPAPRVPEPPPRAAPEEPLRRLPSPSPVAGPCRLPSQRTFLKREFSEKAFSETSFAGGLGCFLFRNVLCGRAGSISSEAPSVTLAAIWARPCLICRAGISLCDLWAYRRWRLAKSPASQIRPVPSPLLPRLLCGLPARHPPARPYRGPRRWPA